MLRSLPAVATLPAIAFLVVVHGTVLAGLVPAKNMTNVPLHPRKGL
jgi:hypothetical protein